MLSHAERRRRFLSASLVVLGLLLAAAPAHAAASFMGLGILPGALSSSANDVSDDGSVVVGTAPTSISRTGGTAEGFRWTAGGGMVALGHLPGGIKSNLAALSSDGSVIIGSDAIVVGQSGGVDIRQSVPFRWTSGGGMVGLGSLGAGVPGTATGISDDGSVVVGSGRFGFSEAFRWTSSGGMVGLGDLAGGTFRSAATGVSGDGSVVVGSSSSGNAFGANGEAFRWTSGGGMVGLGDLAGGYFASWATGVSRDGSVVVGWGVSDSGTEAFRWTSGGGMVGLGLLTSGVSFLASEARDVSADGSVVVGETGPGGIALIWDEVHGMRSLADVLVTDYGLDLTGWKLESATAISSDGSTIVGNGVHTGVAEAWIAVIPEPSTGILFGAGLVMLAAIRPAARRRSLD